MKSKKYVSTMEISKSSIYLFIKFMEEHSWSYCKHYPPDVIESIAVDDTVDGEAESLPEPTLNTYVVREQVLKAEALSAISLAVNHLS